MILLWTVSVGVWIKTDWLSKRQLRGKLVGVETLQRRYLKSVQLRRNPSFCHTVKKAHNDSISPLRICASIMLKWDVMLLACSVKRKHVSNTSNNTTSMQPAVDLYFISFLRGVPKWLLSRPAWDPERLEDDIPHRSGARGSNHLPVWPRLRPGGTRDPHLSVRPVLELSAPVLWKESVWNTCCVSVSVCQHVCASVSVYCSHDRLYLYSFWRPSEL